MQPEDPYNFQPPAAPDLPDAALPSIEPVPVPDPVVASTLPQNPPAAPDILPSDQGRRHLSGVGKKYFNLIEFDDEEQLLAEVRKHPFGLLVIVGLGAFIAVTVFVSVIAIVASGFLDSVGLGGSLESLSVFFGFVLSIFIVIATFINAHLYRNNVVFVTNEKLAQVLFISLFHRKISQLSIGDVQDVTVQQNGFLPNAIGYGTLVIETAGEQQNYTFTFVPEPYETSKVIINAHESNLKKFGN